MKTPNYLKKGDKIGIVCPAKFLPNSIDEAYSILQNWGLEPVLGKSVGMQYHQFSGSDILRANDFQSMLDDTSISAIVAARGGYGSVRIIDKLDFSTFVEKPKWIVGFSDITVFHNHIHKNFDIASIHGQMPVTMPSSKPVALETLRKALFGENLQYEYVSHPLSSKDSCEGVLVGGNLSILLSMMQSKSELNYTNKILFIEDVGEHFYTIDRMLRTLHRAGHLAQLKGLIVGSFTAMKDDAHTPFGFTIPEIILELVNDYHYPVFFDFPAGHQDNNQALVFGKTLRVENKGLTTYAYYK